MQRRGVTADREIDVSEAIALYLKKYPGKNHDEFESYYGARVDLAKEYVRRIIDEATRVEPDWKRLDLNGAGDFVTSVMHERHPDLSSGALIAIGNYYTYLMR
jgi:hypothetical protein